MISDGADSPPETEFRLDAAAAGLPHPQLDVEIRDRTGRLLGISEFLYPEQRVVVEIEGDHHRTSRRQWERDIEKYRNYATIGIEVVRLTAGHRRAGAAVAIVRDVLTRRGWHPTATR